MGKNIPVNLGVRHFVSSFSRLLEVLVGLH